MLKLSDAGVENGWIEREEKLCVISIKVVVQGEWRNKSTERVVYKITSRGPIYDFAANLFRIQRFKFHRLSLIEDITKNILVSFSGHSDIDVH